jgi:hypothetical protein
MRRRTQSSRAALGGMKVSFDRLMEQKKNVRNYRAAPNEEQSRTICYQRAAPTT